MNDLVLPKGKKYTQKNALCCWRFSAKGNGYGWLN
jgi:hypothetical protein